MTKCSSDWRIDLKSFILVRRAQCLWPTHLLHHIRRKFPSQKWSCTETAVTGKKLLNTWVTYSCVYECSWLTLTSALLVLTGGTSKRVSLTMFQQHQRHLLRATSSGCRQDVSAHLYAWCPSIRRMKSCYNLCTAQQGPWNGNSYYRSLSWFAHQKCHQNGMQQ